MVIPERSGETQKAASTAEQELARLKRRLAAETSERRRLEAEMRSLPNQIMTAQDTERRRIARELHDGVNQLLASIKLRLMHAESQIEKAAPGQAETVTQARILLERALTEVRRISNNLRPTELDDFGLVTAIERMVKEFEKRTKIRVELKRNVTQKRFAREVELAFYRIAQEAFANVEEHSGARNVAMALIGDEAFATLNIRDDGKGFVKPKTAAKDRGLGIISMRERANALGGVFSIESKPGEGAEISVHVKLH